MTISAMKSFGFSAMAICVMRAWVWNGAEASSAGASARLMTWYSMMISYLTPGAISMSPMSPATPFTSAMPAMQTLRR